jgi:hypothetical protein
LSSHLFTLLIPPCIFLSSKEASKQLTRMQEKPPVRRDIEISCKRREKLGSFTSFSFLNRGWRYCPQLMTQTTFFRELGGVFDFLQAIPFSGRRRHFPSFKPSIGTPVLFEKQSEYHYFDKQWWRSDEMLLD